MAGLKLWSWWRRRFRLPANGTALAAGKTACPAACPTKIKVSFMKLVLGALIAYPALAQFQSVVPSKATDPFAAPGDPHFVLYADLPSPLPNIVAGYSTVNRMGRLASIGHRYFYDETAHLYFGYDIVIQPQELVDSYRVTFSSLSIGPLDFQTSAPDSLDPSVWKKLPLPAIPAPQVLQAGDPMPIRVFRDPDTGRGLVDTMTVVPMPQMPLRYMSNGREWWQWAHTTVSSGNSTPFRKASNLFGDARQFSADDAEMRLQMGRVAINGREERYADGSRSVSGSLVWFYVPGHGRYVLSLSPRPDLGFVQAGEVRGGLLTFTVDEEDVLLESPAMVAPGDTPYFLYVLHDAAWVPTARGQGGLLLFGSVSPKELAAVAH